ncbi:MAG: PAS domain S-box protein [Chromatiaceae bacterium]|nr:PAS domain S-box protein [Chromatiaceae bacterium]
MDTVISDSETQQPTIDGSDARAIFDANPDAVFILGPDGRIRHANRTAVDRYGYSLKELTSMNAADLAAPGFKGQVQPHLHTALKSGDRFEWRHRCKDGGEFPVEVFANPMIFRARNAFFPVCAISVSASALSHRCGRNRICLSGS